MSGFQNCTISSGSKKITFSNGILTKFEPGFKSIRKDSDRYFDALFDLSEKGIIEANEVIQLSSDGALWITFQYIDKGLLDIVEADAKAAVISRDFYGHLFENTRLTLDRLLEISEVERVETIYRAAIKHRLKAMQEEAMLWKKTRKKHPPNAKSKWIGHYLGPLKNLIKDYEKILADHAKTDPEVEDFVRALRTCELIQNGDA